MRSKEGYFSNYSMFRRIISTHLRSLVRQGHCGAFNGNLHAGNFSYNGLLTGQTCQREFLHCQSVLWNQCEGGSCEIPIKGTKGGVGSKSGETYVESLLQKYPVVIFSSVFCSYCSKAKAVLEKYQLSLSVYHPVEIDDHENLDEIMDYMKKKTGARTLPRVFIGGKCIGGGDDTVQLDATGELRRMLANNGK